MQCKWPSWTLLGKSWLDLVLNLKVLGSLGSILEVFLVPFQGPVPKVKTVLSLESQPHLEGSRVPENHQFSMFFQGLLQVPSQKALWGGLLKIFTDF